MSYLSYKLISTDTSGFYLHESKVVFFERSWLLLPLLSFLLKQCYSNVIKVLQELIRIQSRLCICIVQFKNIDLIFCNKRLIVFNEICNISRKSRISQIPLSQSRKFRKFQEDILLTVINEIFKFPPHSDPFGQVNYFS